MVICNSAQSCNLLLDLKRSISFCHGGMVGRTALIPNVKTLKVLKNENGGIEMVTSREPVLLRIEKREKRYLD